MNLLSGDHRNNASLAVAVERTLVRPGETLKGYVELDVTGTFSCSDLSVNFMGVAKSAVQFSERMQQYDGGVAGQAMYDYDQPDMMAGTGINQRMAVESRSLCNLFLPLANFPTGIAEVGKYQFPFELPVPADIPPSVAQQRGNASMAHAVYTLSVQALRPGITTFDVVKEVILDVAAAAPTLPPTPSTFCFDTQDMMSMFCFFLGSVTVGGQLESSTVEAGKPLALKWQVEGTTSNLNAIEAKLIRTVSIYARGYSSSATTTVAEIDLSAGMDLSQDSEGNEETPEEHIQHFIVPEDCAPSVSIGRMLSISYSVVIHADGGCCVQGPRICLPVEVVRCSAIPSSAWGGIKGQSSECGISTPEGFSPNPALKGSPQEIPATGWMVVNDGQEPMGALYGYAGYTASYGAGEAGTGMIRSASGGSLPYMTRQNGPLSPSSPLSPRGPRLAGVQQDNPGAAGSDPFL